MSQSSLFYHLGYLSKKSNSSEILKFRDHLIEDLQASSTVRDFACLGAIRASKLWSSPFLWQQDLEINILYTKKKVSIGFASESPDNPVSMFGHTFLIFHNSETPEPDSIVVEFLGQTENLNTPYLKALTTGIPGKYKLTPYVIKRIEYFKEDRDIWIYNMSFSSSIKTHLIQKIENKLSNPYPYLFLSTNCSSYILALLLDEPIPPYYSYYTIPVHTLRTLQKKNFFISDPIQLKSHRQLAELSYYNLSRREKKQLHNLLNHKTTSPDLGTNDLVMSLNNSLTYLTPKEHDAKKREYYFFLKKQIVINRQQSDVYKISSLYEDSSNNPLIKLGDSNLRIGSSTIANSQFIEFKPAQRDFHTSFADSLSSAYLEVMKTKFGLYNEKLFLDQLTIFKQDSHIPSTYFSSGFNRYVDIGYYKRFFPETFDNAGEFLTQLGFGYSIGTKLFMLGAMPIVGIRYSDDLDGSPIEPDLNLRLTIKTWLTHRLGLETSLTTNYKTQIYYHQNLSLQMNYKINNSLSLSNSYIQMDDLKNNELSLNFNW